MLPLLWKVAVAGLAQDPLTKSFATSPADVRRVRVNVDVGRAVITNGTDDSIQVEIRLESRDSTRLATCAQSTIESRVNDGELVIRLDQPGRKQCSTRWTVRLPRGMALDASIEVGDIEATLAGRYGDISVRSDVGSVESSRRWSEGGFETPARPVRRGANERRRGSRLAASIERGRCQRIDQAYGREPLSPDAARNVLI